MSLASFLGNGACVFDYDGDGKPDIFLVNADGKGNAVLLHNVGHGKFVDVTKSAKLQFLGEGTGCAAGDYDNDGHPDLVVSSGDGITLFHNEGDGTFKDVTDAAGVRTIGLALGVTFVDYDHDGDLDIYVVRFNNFPLDNSAQPFTFPDDARPPGNILWRNLGGGTFGDYTKQTGLGGSAASVAALESDLSNDGTLDLVVTGWEKTPEIFVNALEGPFQSATPWVGETPPRAAGAVALDFDHDGRMDLAFTHWAPPGLSLWRNTGRKGPQGAPSFERVSIPDPGWMRAWGIAAFDYDNDGWTDLVAVGETFAGKGQILLLRNEGVGSDGQVHFRDVTHATGLDKIILRNPRSVIAFDPEGDGSADLLITQNGLPPVLLKNVGGNENDWLQLALSGDVDNRDRHRHTRRNSLRCAQAVPRSPRRLRLPRPVSSRNLHRPRRRRRRRRRPPPPLAHRRAPERNANPRQPAHDNRRTRSGRQIEAGNAKPFKGVYPQESQPEPRARFRRSPS